MQAGARTAGEHDPLHGGEHNERQESADHVGRHGPSALMATVMSEIRQPMSVGDGRLVVVDLDFDTCYRSLQARDTRFDGWFFTAVRTTGIYCRPPCPRMTPHRSHATVHP